MNVPQPLVVSPGPPLAGEFTPPGDKSITHRAILFGLLADGETVIDGPNPGADCLSSLACAEALGAIPRVEPGRFTVRGGAGALREPAGVLDCGNSGTTLRLLAGMIASQPLFAVLAGDGSLNRRPVARVVDPLRRMGATLTARGGDRLPPLAIRGGALAPIQIDLAVASAQVATCLLLAGLSTRGTTSVALPGPARDHTERMLPAFGVPVESTPNPGAGPRLAVRGPVVPRATRLRVPGDFSAAAFFLAAAAGTPGARVTARGVSLNPTRTGLLDVLAAMGARVDIVAQGEQAGEPVGDITIVGPDALRAFDVPAGWVPRLIDEVPAWAVAASAARGVSRLEGAAELRVKESDRLAALARGLEGLGVRCTEHPEGLAIEGGPVAGGTVDALGDHRIAMAFAVLASRATGPVTIDDAACISTSYPGFGVTFVGLGGRVRWTGLDRTSG